MQYGRQIIWTDEPEITYDNVIEVLRKAMQQQGTVSSDIDELIEYDAGNQILQRVKRYRPDIDSVVIDNCANEVVEFKLGYFWGTPATFVQRGTNDYAVTDELAAIPLLNEYYDASGHRTKTQENARFIEIGGIGYTYIDINMEYEDGDSPFTRDVLDPRTTFVIRSSYYTDHRKMVGVTFRTGNTEKTRGIKYYTCFTRTQRFELNTEKGDLAHAPRSGEKNPLGRIPIIEWFRSYDRMGCFERQMSEMDNLNLLVSDVTNDIEQNTQMLWVSTDLELPVKSVTAEDGSVSEEVVKPAPGEWLQMFSSQDGRTPSVKPLVVDYNYDGMINNIAYRRSLILQKCDVPMRNSTSGGSTGVAMSDATGWSQAEAAACLRQIQWHLSSGAVPAPAWFCPISDRPDTGSPG